MIEMRVGCSDYLFVGLMFQYEWPNIKRLANLVLKIVITK